jgi:hypothetical protein
MTLHRNYMSLGKEVLRDGRHVADAIDGETAALIAEALNHAPATLDKTLPEPRAWFGYADDIGTTERTDDPAGLHFIQRQGDEYACACGVRWDVTDGEEHP